MKEFFRTLPRNLICSFWGKNFLWHILAWILTYIIVVSGFDCFYFLHTRTSLIGALAIPAFILGGILPITVPFILLWIGHSRKDQKLILTSWAMGQAAVIGYLVSIFYKTFTGRVQPDVSNVILDSSRGFNFGILRHGVFWGWPSSHTTVAFAVSVALIYLYPKNKKVFWLALLYALYIGFAVATRIHWFSEFIAGAIMGSVVGRVVGKSFRKN